MLGPEMGGPCMTQFLVLASLVLGMTMPCVAWSETIADLVSREDGVDFGRCELTPRPHLRGAVVHAVIPAWFEKPGIWSTRSLLLVGVDDSGTVQQQRKLRLGASVPPREVVSINCSGSRLDVRLSRQASGRTLAHRWTGTQLDSDTQYAAVVRGTCPRPPPVPPDQTMGSQEYDSRVAAANPA